MPLKIVPPRPGKTPNWSVRGTYLRQPVDQTAGSPRRAVAVALKRRIERAIESGEFERRTIQSRGEPTFLTAALAYVEAGGERRYIKRLVEHFGETPLGEIAQTDVDDAAVAICPGATPATRNRTVYTPVSAILKTAGKAIVLARPKGAKGRVVTDHLIPPDAQIVIAAAWAIDRRFAVLLTFLLFTGCRLGEALAIRRAGDLRLSERRAWVGRSKNGEPREVVLREDLCTLIEELVGDDTTGRLFPFHQGGHLKHLLTRAKLKALALPCPARRPTGWRQPPNRLAFVNFHTFCHTWATWLRRYGGIDLQGLVGTRRWKSLRSAARYAHVVARDEWQRVEQLPAVNAAAPIRGGNVESTRDTG